ncbi:glycine--tRNA ligase subunit beta [Desulfobulbus alkaliphilus]|uniref:glycine--tRNA ligase subunit beta n=1 Tax=Desulfobulbus alkaliphilus TaxID=869814 RepID=UPI001963BD21|nr:glycine--tRNA ligase subunit beta [Desulfobulbus alkaliphilus]MBM9535514.1 glycine--tRNA ligase subunit beta [Desulfobulbus alkaliphilus]
MSELLFEIGTEEIPAGYIQPALDALAAGAARKLEDLNLGFDSIRTFGTPRRLTLVIGAVQSQQEDRRQEHIGPSKKAGFDAEGRLTQAAIGFARSRGLQPEQLQVISTAKGEYLLAVEDIKGQETMALLPALLESLVHELVFPKSMRWADKSMTFGRPIQWLLALYNGKVVPLDLEGMKSGNTTRGHRFMAPEPFAVSDLESYLSGLRERFVLADPVERRALVVEAVQQAVDTYGGNADARPVLEEGLVDTVTNLVEWPYGICGHFDRKFLRLPQETLVTSMREHQKYFPVAGADGNLLPLFVAVNNTGVKDMQLAASGHERVLRARLEDGLFFFNEDRRRPLVDRCAQLDGIVFQNRLGTMKEKSERITALAAILADRIAPDLREDVTRAANLAKADLLTAMVGEFPSLQGIMGRVYALRDGEKAEVAQAIEEHYQPLRAGGHPPSSLIGALVGLADRMDTLVGCFAIGEKPTGNKDAFGLRRQAIGLLSIIRGLNISLSIRDAAESALQGYAGLITDAAEKTVADVLAFIRLRFENEQVARGLSQELVEAATSVGFDDPVDCLARLNALDQLRGQESFRVLAGSFKRIRNIIKDNATTEVSAALLTDPAEQALFNALEEVRSKALPLLGTGSYHAALDVMLTMKEPVDHFFDKVLVMAEDPAVRQNRLNLLTALGELVLQVGDISRMHVEKE